MIWRSTWLLWSAFLVLAGLPLLSGCGRDGASAAAEHLSLNVRITPELQPVVAQYHDLAAATGIRVTFSPTFTDAETDAHWGLGIGKTPEGSGLADVRLYPAPVVLGVKAATAQAFGWCERDWTGRLPPFGRTTWAELTRRAAANELHFALHHPAYSELGAATINALRLAVGPGQDGDFTTPPPARAFGQGHRRLYPGYVNAAEHYLAHEAHLNALFAPEALITALNADPRLQSPLCPVWLMDGTPLPGYTLGLFNQLKRREFAAVAGYLARRARAVDMHGATARPAPEWRKSHPLRVLVRTYLEYQLSPATLVIAINTARPFGRGLRAAKDGLLAWLDHPEAQERFSRLRHGEHLVVAPYARDLRPGYTETLNRAQPDFLAGARGYLNQLAVGGAGAALPAAALTPALARLAQSVPERPPGARLNLIVLTDVAAAQQLLDAGGGDAFASAFVIGLANDAAGVCIGSLHEPGARLRCQDARDLGALLVALRGHH